MTLLYIDGFAHNNTSRYATNGDSLLYYRTSTPRTTGNYYAQLSASTTVDIQKSFAASAEIFVGIGFRAAALNMSIISLRGDSGATSHLTLRINSSGQIEVRRGTGSGTVIATGTTVVTAASWHYYEIRATINDTTGIVQVRLDGNTTPEIDFVGDTKNAGTATTFDAVSLAGPTGTANLFADFYICNTAGSVNNAWLGDSVVRTLVPAGNGNSSQLVGSDGNSTDNYLLVDEIPPSSTDYVGSATVGEKDTYVLPDLPAGVTVVRGVQVAANLAKSDAGAASAKIVTRVGGTDYAPDTTSLSTSYVETTKLWDVSPATSTAWTAAEVNGMEIGVEVA